LKNIKVTQLKNMIKNNTPLNEMGIEVKSYLPMLDKMTLIESIVFKSIIFEGNIAYKSDILFTTFYEIELMMRYSNINFSHIDPNDDNYAGKLYEYYDFLKENNIVDYAISLIPDNEKQFIDTCINNQIQQRVESSRQLTVLVDRWVQAFLDKLPQKEDLNKMVDEFNKFDPEKVSIVKDMIKAAK
jgi:hypothetical protein